MGDEPRAVFALEPGHVGVPSASSLTTTERKDLAGHRLEERLRRQAREVTEAIAAAADIDDDDVETDENGKVIARRAPPRPSGLADRAFRVARDARRSNKDAPVYLKHLVDIHRSYVAADAAKGADSIPLNITIATQVNLVVHQYGAADYPVKELTDDEQ